MRVYHFLPAEQALDDIARQHIKISQIDSLNDPFELWCSAQEDREARHVLRAWKRDMAQQYGMLCFCKDWHNPVLWSHYADPHPTRLLANSGPKLSTVPPRNILFVDDEPSLRVNHL